MPHPGRGFTQGLIAEGETVWESGGQYGLSVLRRYELGAARWPPRRGCRRSSSPRESAGSAGASCSSPGGSGWRCAGMPPPWRSREKVRFNREGWGICAVPVDKGASIAPGTVDNPVDEVVTSDGSSELVRRDPVTLAPREVVHVRCGESRVRWLNDLAWAGGLVWANVLGTTCLAGIDLDTGAVTDVVDARAAGERHAPPADGHERDRRARPAGRVPAHRQGLALNPACPAYPGPEPRSGGTSARRGEGDDRRRPERGPQRAGGVVAVGEARAALEDVPRAEVAATPARTLQPR